MTWWLAIRMALGAQQGDVVKLVGWTGLRFAIAGTVLGAIGAFALTRTMSGLLFGVSSFDMATFSAMAAALIAVTMAGAGSREEHRRWIRWWRCAMSEHPKADG